MTVRFDSQHLCMTTELASPSSSWITTLADASSATSCSAGERRPSTPESCVRPQTSNSATEVRMQIGHPLRTIIVEPVELPEPEPDRDPFGQPSGPPQPEPKQEPASK